jgi:ligand-binding sensor domain-containing protein
VNRARIKNVAAVSVLTVLCPSAFALDPSLDINQYAHKAWTIREGFFKSRIFSMAQTPDGYLLLGTEFGLLRFDGVRAVEWTPPGSERLGDSRITSLLTGRDGTLWIGTQAGLASWNGAGLTRYPELQQHVVGSVLEDHEGTIWAGGINAAATGRLCGIRGRKTECYGQDGSLGRGVLSLHEDGSSNLWAGAASGLWLWRPDALKRYAMPEVQLDSLLEGDGGKLLIGTPGGIMQLVNGKAVPYRISGVAAPRGLRRLFQDRDGGLWIGTAGEGLFHVHHGRTDIFSRRDGLSSDDVATVFEDREGNVWVATLEGLSTALESCPWSLFPASRACRRGLPGPCWRRKMGASG